MTRPPSLGRGRPAGGAAGLEGGAAPIAAAAAPGERGRGGPAGPARRASRRERIALALLVGAALALRLALVASYEEHHPLADRPLIDEASYERWALEIAGGDWLGSEVFFQEPLYPYWLGSVYALAGVETEGDVPAARTLARRAQACLGAVGVALVWLVARRVFGPTAALVAAAGAALHRPLVYVSALLLKPSLVVPCLALLAWCLVRARLPGEPEAHGEAGGRRAAARAVRGWLAVGLVAGLGALLRGNVLVLVPVLVLWPLARARVLRLPLVGASALPAAAVLAGALLVLLPVAARNQAVGGVFALTTSGAGTNLYGGNAPENRYGRATELPWVRGIPEHEAEDWRREAEARSGRALDPGEVSSYWLGETLRSFAARPLVHLGILWRKLRLTLGRYEVPDNHMLDWDARHVPALRAPLPGWAVLGWLGLAGAALLALGALAARAPALRRWRGLVAAPDAPGEAWTLLVLLALYVATIVLTVTSMRARLALVPLVLPFAGWLVVALARAARAAAPDARAALRRTAPHLAALALAAPFAWSAVLPPAERAEDLAKRDFNHAVYLLEAGKLDEAAALAERLSREHGPTSRVQTLLAEVDYWRARALERAGQGAEARARLSTALLALDPVLAADAIAPRERFRAHALAGRVHAELRDWPAAEEHLRAARAFDPDDQDLRLRLAQVLLLRARETVDPAAAALRRRRLEESLALLESVRDEPGAPPAVPSWIRDVEEELAGGR